MTYLEENTGENHAKRQLRSMHNSATRETGSTVIFSAREPFVLFFSFVFPMPVVVPGGRTLLCTVVSATYSKEIKLGCVRVFFVFNIFCSTAFTEEQTAIAHVFF